MKCSLVDWGGVQRNDATVRELQARFFFSAAQQIAKHVIRGIYVGQRCSRIEATH